MDEHKVGRRNAQLMSAIRHHREGRLNQAERLYQQLHRAAPRDAEVIYLLGVLCCDLGLFEPACRFLEQALAITPAFREAQRQLAVARMGLAEEKLALGRWDEAEAFLARALEIVPDDVNGLNRLGLAQLQQDKFAAAELSLRHALRLQPNLNQARNTLGLALHRLDRLSEAKQCFEEALERDPAYTNARVNLANTLRILGRHAAARAELETILALQPDLVDALNNLGAVAQDVGDTQLALACLSRAIELAPGNARIRWNLALSQLQSGDFTNGWHNFESRWEGCGQLRGGYALPEQRAWRGEPLQGKRLLLWAEQGFGDTLQFIRFARDVALLGATVQVLVPPELARLVAGVPGVSGVTVQGDVLPPFDFHSPLMSLPYRLGLSLDPIALHGDLPYLSAADHRVEHWRARLAGHPGLKVGLVWAASSRGHSAELAAIDARRSLEMHQLAPLLSVPGCEFFSLQKGAAFAQDSPAPMRDFSVEWTDFADTAAFVANLDLVISVDTAVAHLAGALGKPVWLLNRFDTCWRWLLSRTDSPWYSSLRQFHQPAAGNWEPPIAAAALELAAAVRHRESAAAGAAA